jgi:hypothetical protein
MCIAQKRLREGLPRYEVRLFWRSAQQAESTATVMAGSATLISMARQD